MLDGPTVPAGSLPPMPSPLAGAIGSPWWNEARAPLELARLARTPVPLACADGRRVVLATGFMAPASSVKPLTSWLRKAGYAVQLARLGGNLTTSSHAVDRIIEALEGGDGPGVLIGHSRGGQQSRVAALRRPDLVEQLITLGAPVRAHLPRNVALRASVEVLRVVQRPAPDLVAADERYEQDLYAPFDVDVAWTSIWARRDGVVEWQACLDEAAHDVGVACSHTGLVASVPSFHAIAAALGTR